MGALEDCMGWSGKGEGLSPVRPKAGLALQVRKDENRDVDASELLARYANGKRIFRQIDAASIDLGGANLSGVDIGDAHLVGANLRGANLNGSAARCSNLANADLWGARLRHAEFGDVDLRRAKLCSAEIDGTDFRDATLIEADLHDARGVGASFLNADASGAVFSGANLSACDFEGACLRRADLSGTDLRSANLERADLSMAILGGAVLDYARLQGANLSGAMLDGVQIGNTVLVEVGLAPLASANVIHGSPSIIDYTSILLSIHAPGLKQFLRDAGMPEVFAEYMISCARSLNPNERFSLMLSSFISYGGPDEEFARRLNRALKENGVTTFFYPLDAKLGQRNASVMHRGIKEHDRVVLICSEASLTRLGVLTELTEVADEEARRGGDTCLIPIRLDDYVLSKEFLPKNPDLRELIISRVVGDFRGADTDEPKFKAALPRLVEALRKPVVIPGVGQG